MSLLWERWKDSRSLITDVRPVVASSDDAGGTENGVD